MKRKEPLCVAARTSTSALMLQIGHVISRGIKSKGYSGRHRDSHGKVQNTDHGGLNWTEDAN
jgi:hypothetical protein